MENVESSFSSWLSDLKTDIQTATRKSKLLEQQDQSCIMRVHRRNTKCMNDYEPQMVSLGPYHHGKRNLQAFEDYKRKALVHFLRRSKIQPEEFVEAVEQDAEPLMKCYDKPEKKWSSSSQDFVKLMLTDGCFVLEIVHLAFEYNMEGYPPHEPFLGPDDWHHKIILIREDMLLLENQLPFRLLYSLLTVLHKSPANKSTLERDAKRILRFIHWDNPLKMVGVEDLKTARHPLDYLYSSMSLESRPQLPQLQEGYVLPTTKTALELSNAGVKFIPSESIAFSNGIFKLPFMKVEEKTRRKLLNLIAYERILCETTTVTTYLNLMVDLMKTPEDVSVLCAAGIIHDCLESPQEVVKLYRDISCGLPRPNADTLSIRFDISSYWDSKRRSFGVYLKRTYFRSPWAFLLLVLLFSFISWWKRLLVWP
ncbi:hypothetical protein IHE45_14G090600 [Dioscorea alata]|uniref:Uncharacterized protein n=1 Tax=Dioscorea alata TaxID=55571 RepID=A0ACB7UT74_DIOAL|nr:hypothetical protein IHE45_14G090600 [Dioscorea alata]